MKVIIGYIRKYIYELDKIILGFTTLFLSVLIALNYYFEIDERIAASGHFWTKFFARGFIFLAAFGFPYIIYALFARQEQLRRWRFLLLIILAPFLFAYKAAFNFVIPVSDDPEVNTFWSYIYYWPGLLLITTLLVYVLWKIYEREQPFYGMRTTGVDWKPYWLMLVIMLPLIMLAATQPDFQATYPKIKLISNLYDAGELEWWQVLLFELSYGSDFFTIELFFRGFLILAFMKWAGTHAILPMAAFYCTIHFGKPLGECISSYFGGMILGVVVYHTRSIFGGLMVHLGIAWLMEIAGFIANSIKE